MSLRVGVAGKWRPVDWIVVSYTVWMAGLIALCAARVPEWPRLLAIHAGIVTLLLIIPPRRATWEERPASVWLRPLHEFVRFVRYVYPLPLALFFFEEGRYTVNMIFPGTPYWFEPRLYAADIAMFGGTPARLLDVWVTPTLTEVMHFFYWSYYIILIGGVLLAFVGSSEFRSSGRRPPAPGFEETITSLALAFISAFVFYPWLAARGPWESASTMQGLTPLDGFAFTWMMDRIIEHGAVSGNCFPSGHVAGAWAIVFGLAWTRGHRTMVWIGTFLSIGMTVACVYTRYHHAADMPAGFACGLLGGVVGGWLVRRRAGAGGFSAA